MCTRILALWYNTRTPCPGNRAIILVRISSLVFTPVRQSPVFIFTYLGGIPPGGIIAWW